MTLRRDFLAMTAGAVAARTVLPMAARAETNVRASDNRPHPDAELIRVCAEHPGRIDAYNNSPGDIDGGDPSHVAYDHSRDFISEAKPRTLEGIVAKAGAAKAEAVGLDGEEDPNGTMAEIWAWDLVNDLLRLGGV